MGSESRLEPLAWLLITPENQASSRNSNLFQHHLSRLETDRKGLLVSEKEEKRSSLSRRRTEGRRDDAQTSCRVNNKKEGTLPADLPARAQVNFEIRTS